MTNDPSPVPARRAGLVTRLTAFVLDAFTLFVMLRSTAWILNASARTLHRFAPPVDLGSLLIAGFPILLGAYFVGFWRAIGQTPGKWLMGIKIVAEGGGRLTVGQAIIRLFGYLLSALPFYLGFLWILGPERRGWHDRLARTEVVYAARRRAAPRPEIGWLRGPPDLRPRKLSPGAPRPREIRPGV
jgi:uncharacterized RDD family membrane protein YckC